MRILTGLLPLVLATVGWAQTDVTATLAELSVSFGVVRGHLAAAKNQLVFVNADTPGQSFAIERQNIAGATMADDVLTIRTTDPVENQSQFNFRLESTTAAQALLAWARSPATTSATEAGSATGSSRLSFDVRDQRLFRGDEQGKLIVTDDQLLYESITAVGRSRRWALRDIKELKLKNPYKLVVKPFVGDDYTFTLVGDGMAEREYREIAGRIARQRTSR